MVGHLGGQWGSSWGEGRSRWGYGHYWEGLRPKKKNPVDTTIPSPDNCRRRGREVVCFWETPQGPTRVSWCTHFSTTSLTTSRSPFRCPGSQMLWGFVSVVSHHSQQLSSHPCSVDGWVRLALLGGHLSLGTKVCSIHTRASSLQASHSVQHISNTVIQRHPSLKISAILRNKNIEKIKGNRWNNNQDGTMLMWGRFLEKFCIYWSTSNIVVNCPLPQAFEDKMMMKKKNHLCYWRTD